MKDLEGILVVAVEHAVAAPMASCKLADAGARVIKVERDEGDFARSYDDYVNGESAYFVWLNRGKESICLNLKLAEDKIIFDNMLRDADIFIQNLAPHAMERLGYDPDSLHKLNPRLISCTITGYPNASKYNNKKAYDLLIQGESGLLSVTGNHHGFARIGVSVCDIATGTTAYNLILQALYARTKTGMGRHIEVPLYSAISDWMNVPYLQYKYGGKKSTPSGIEHPTIAPYGAFKTADGKQLILSIQNEREWQIFCKDILENEQLSNEPKFMNNRSRVSNRSEVNELCATYFLKHNILELVEKLDKANIAYGRIAEVDDIGEHPATQFSEVETPSGKISVIAPVTSKFGEAVKLGKVPALDHHGDDIRKEFSNTA